MSTSRVCVSVCVILWKRDNYSLKRAIIRRAGGWKSPQPAQKLRKKNILECIWIWAHSYIINSLYFSFLLPPATVSPLSCRQNGFQVQGSKPDRGPQEGHQGRKELLKNIHVKGVFFCDCKCYISTRVWRLAYIGEKGSLTTAIVGFEPWGSPPKSGNLVIWPL